MSYIGNSSNTQSFTPAVDYFSGNGVATSFTLSRSVGSTAQIQVIVNNVIQNPSTAYTVLNNTLTFTGAPSSGTNNVYVYYTSPVTQSAVIPQSPQIVGDTITGGGVYSKGAFSNAFTSGLVADYSGSQGRFSVGSSAGFGFYNGGIASSALVTIDQTGKLGVGTTSPGTLLEIYKSLASTTTAQQMLILNTDYSSGISAGFGGAIVFRGRTVGNVLQDNAQILAYNEDLNDNGYALGFFTRPNVGAGAPVQRLTILRGGNVGIGTTTPSSVLNLYAASKPTLTFGDATLGNSYGAQITGFGVSGNGGYLSMGTMDNGVYNEGIQVQQQATSVIFKTNNGSNGVTAARLTINTSGQITTPSQPYILCSMYNSGSAPNYFNLSNQSSRNLSLGTASGYSAVYAPVSGVYLITVNTITQSDSIREDVFLYKNGGLLLSSLTEANGSGYHYRTITTSILLNSGDYIQVYQQGGSFYNTSAKAFGSGGEWSNFSMVLLG